MGNYIMRIVSDEFEASVFSKKAYYTAMRRRWSKGIKILFVKKSPQGDSFIGYAIVDRVLSIEEMDINDKRFCLENAWSNKIVFSRLVRLEPPVLVKNTVVGKWPQKGALLHGAPISDEDLNTIVELASIRINY